MKLIDKENVVAEIERRKHKLLDHIMFERDKEWVVRTAHQLNKIILFLDDLEVKDVDLEKAIDRWICDAAITHEDCSIDDVIRTAKHFYELGLNAMKGE